MGDTDQFASFDKGYSKMRDEPLAVKLSELEHYDGHNNIKVTANILGVGPLHDFVPKKKIPAKSKAHSLLIGDETGVANAHIWFPTHHGDFVKNKGRTVVFNGFKAKVMDEVSQRNRTSIGIVGLEANEGIFQYEVLPKGDSRGHNFPNGRDRRVPQGWLFTSKSSSPSTLGSQKREREEPS